MISIEKKFVFVHIPRCAGTSIEKVISPFCLPLEGRTDKTRPYSPKHDTIGQYANSFDLRGFYRFSFVRHPLTRMISIYKWGGEIAMLRKGVGWKSPSFNTWITSDEWRIGWIEDGKYVLPPFKRTQSRWLRGKIDMVGKFENLDNDWQVIASRLGLPAPLPKLHFTSSEVVVKPNKLAKAIIYTHFREDLERFGYEKL